MWSGGPITAQFDVVVDISEDCRAKAKAEWEALWEYHKNLSDKTRNFQASVKQLHAENPISINPIIEPLSGGMLRSSPSGKGKSPSSIDQPAAKSDKQWWKFWG
jgi:hypothetical protein